MLPWRSITRSPRSLFKWPVHSRLSHVIESWLRELSGGRLKARLRRGVWPMVRTKGAPAVNGGWRFLRRRAYDRPRADKSFEADRCEMGDNQAEGTYEVFHRLGGVVESDEQFSLSGSLGFSLDNQRTRRRGAQTWRQSGERRLQYRFGFGQARAGRRARPWRGRILLNFMRVRTTEASGSIICGE
jgi:hypothetical protein